MDKKRLSDKIEDTIEGFILFLFRYIYTFLYVVFRPHRLSQAISVDSYKIVPPFTFLSISCFLYAVLVAPAFSSRQPETSSIMPQMAPDFNEIAIQAVTKISEATIPSVILAGLPVLLTVSMLSYLFSLMLFKGDYRKQGFDIYAYAFGTHSLLQVVSQAAFITVVLVDAPWLSNLPELAFNLPFWIIAGYALVLPFIIVFFGFAKTSAVASKTRKIRGYVLIVGSCFLVPVSYTQSSLLVQSFNQSISPVHGFKITLGDSYDVHKAPTGYIFSGVIYFDNPTNKDQVFDTNSVLITFEENKWIVPSAKFYASTGARARLINIKKNSSEVFGYSFHVIGVDGFFRDSLAYDEETETLSLSDSLFVELSGRDDIFKAVVKNPQIYEGPPIQRVSPN